MQTKLLTKQCDDELEGRSYQDVVLRVCFRIDNLRADIARLLADHGLKL